MQQLRLQKLTLENFRGLKAITITPEGEDFTIAGDNRLGKTTCGDGITWLLFGKDMQGRSDAKFALKTLDAEGNELGHLDHSVEGVFLLNGTELVLKKIYKEIHTRKRGAAQKVFTGHTTEYFINGVGTTAGKFKAQIAEIASEETFRLLTVPDYFAEGVKWEKRREVLLDIIENVSDDQVIATNRALARLPSILNGKAVEDFMAIRKSERTKTNEKLDEIPTRIDENSRRMPDISGIDAKKTAQAMVAIDNQVAGKRQTVAGLDSGGAAFALKSDLSAVDDKIAGFKRQAEDARANTIRAKGTRKANLLFDLQTATNRQSGLGSQRDGLLAEQGTLQNKRAQLSQDFDTLSSIPRGVTSGLTCDSCTQVIPDELQISVFESQRSRSLQEINEAGVEMKTRLSKIDLELKGLEEGLRAAQVEVDGFSQKIEAASQEISAMLGAAAKPEDIAGYVEAVAERAKLMAEIEAAEAGGDNSALRQKLTDELEALRAEKSGLQASMDLVDEHHKLNTRNDELREEEKRLAQEVEAAEADIFLMEEFVRAKVAMLDESIQQRFPGIKFKLFKENINGGLVPCCDVLITGVPYESANTAARINTGLQIIRTLSEYYGVRLPVIVDRAESVNQLASPNTQLIKLVVSKDKKLTFSKG
jgi:predicted  nucleic acid-binding Zn-ribbon protein